MSNFFNRIPQKSLRQALRNRMTRGERMLWYYLRKGNVGRFKFRRQYGIGPYVVDFYCPEARLAVEIDGDSHFQAGADKKDWLKQHFIEEQDIRVIRFSDNDVSESLPAVIEIIEKHLTPSNSPSKRGRKNEDNSPSKRGRK